MYRNMLSALLAVSLAAYTLLQAAPAGAEQNAVRAIVTQAVRPVMKQYGIPGMAIGVTIKGRHYIFRYGIASKATGKPIDDNTLFEIGSITKTFTASLVSYAQLMGRLSFPDEASADFPALRGTSFDHIRLANLGTYTAGGLPLQFPDEIKSDDDALQYYQHWKPSHAAGTFRLYSNPSIMLLGLIAAHSMHTQFTTLMQHELFTPLGLRHTFLNVPNDLSPSYAQGYTDADEPRRMSAGPLGAEAYGIRTTAPDLLRFIDANMDLVHLHQTLRRAIINTHSGFYRIGPMTQDLVWEQYRLPITLADLLRGNGDQMIFEKRKVREITPPSRPRNDVILNKTGSTNGFAAYVAFVPRTMTGIVLLANKSYPIAARVTTAYQILSRLGATSKK